MAKTITTGNKGEAFIHSIIEGMGNKILKKWSNNSDWDLIIQLPNGNQHHLEVKTQPRYLKYGGFSVEVGNKRLGNYIYQPKDFTFEGSPCVFTGLAVSNADFYVFTNGRNMIYFVPTKALKEWFKRIKTQEEHRIKFGGYDRRSLQAQIKIEELEKISAHIINLKRKRGPKPSQVARIKVVE
jgi:hypothetical protein